MIGIKKEGVKPKERRYTKTFGFALGKGDTEKMLVAKNSRHCDCRDGKLQSGIGFSTYLRNNAAVTYRAKTAREIYPIKVLSTDGLSYTDSFIVSDENGFLYYHDTSSSSFKMKTTCGDNSHICAAIGADKKMTVAIAAWGKLDLMNQALAITSTGLKTTGAVCFFKHRLFCGVRPNVLYYSAPNDWTNFTESIDDGGWVNFGGDYGEMVSLCEFKDTLYVFFEYAIFRMRAAGSARDFSPERLRYGGDKIFGRTVGICGNVIFFLAKDGVYRFNGNVAERVETGITVSETYAKRKFSCAACGGKMAIRYYDKDDVGQTIIIYEDGKSWYFVDEIVGLSPCDGRAMGLNNMMIAYLDEKGTLPIDKTFYFNDCETDFGFSGMKTMSKLRFKGKGTFSLTLRNGLKETEKMITFKDGIAELALKERGDVFGVDIRLYAGTKIDNVTAEYQVLK